MPATLTLKTLTTTLALSLPLVSITVLALPSQIEAATLPNPYVSRALDAVLLPVNADTIAAFGLAADETGVVVLAVAPGGVADTAGIAPGDVIASVKGSAIKDPVYLDEVVYYWIRQGQFDFGFDGWRAGSVQTYTTTVTEQAWSTVIDVAAIATWTAYSSESFSYSDYYSEYSSEISASYDSSEAMIEETSAATDFAAQVTAEEAATDAAAADMAPTDMAPADPAAVDDSTGNAAMTDDGSADPSVDDANRTDTTSE